MAEATFSPNDLLVSDVPVITRNITLISGQNLKRGAVIGNITASDKYTLSATASADGSQTPDLVLAIDCDASAGDVVTAAYASGAFDSTKLIIGAGHTPATVEAAFRKKSAPLYVRVLK
ncbi:head decoration protein [Neorhizobium galegae]|uniref:head decoration protein n=1 Tax=Neorhizobium galegae TaxID=399 RepID=UPI002104C68F|nr:head decoration protein [Neorhizobium galegae]MCQ1766132.1 head decoration protein [Neorhizobium galegae]MCQ1845046.1 head decoration protein [Neorhizobium galegae]